MSIMAIFFSIVTWTRVVFYFHFNKLLMDVLAEVRVKNWKMVHLGNVSHAYVLFNIQKKKNTIGKEII